MEPINNVEELDAVLSHARQLSRLYREKKILFSSRSHHRLKEGIRFFA
jgi:hypothetical protein